MLKKHPNVVETIKRIRRYVGNVKDWQFTNEECSAFNENAAKVRDLSDSIYNKFKVKNNMPNTANKIKYIKEKFSFIFNRNYSHFHRQIHFTQTS